MVWMKHWQKPATRSVNKELDRTRAWSGWWSGWDQRKSGRYLMSEVFERQGWSQSGSGGECPGGVPWGACERRREGVDVPARKRVRREVRWLSTAQGREGKRRGGGDGGVDDVAVGCTKRRVMRLVTGRPYREVDLEFAKKPRLPQSQGWSSDSDGGTLVCFTAPPRLKESGGAVERRQQACCL